jgi:hypothetical protein
MTRSIRWLLVIAIIGGCSGGTPSVPPPPSRGPSASNIAPSSPATQSTPSAPSASQEEPSAEVYTFNGSGDRVFDVFELPAGTYELEWAAKAQANGCVVSIELHPIGHEELVGFLAGGIVPGGQKKSGQELDDLDGGRYALEVSGDSCSWTVNLSAIK